MVEGNGNGTVAALEETVPDESQEQLQGAYLELSKLKRGDGSLVTLGKQEMSLLRQILSTGTDEWKETWFWRMCRFADPDEAKDHVDAFYEAKELGMDTSFNVAYAFSLVSTKREGLNALIDEMLDTMQHGKWAGAAQQQVKHGNGRSPIGN